MAQQSHVVADDKNGVAALARTIAVKKSRTLIDMAARLNTLATHRQPCRACEVHVHAAGAPTKVFVAQAGDTFLTIAGKYDIREDVNWLLLCRDNRKHKITRPAQTRLRFLAFVESMQTLRVYAEEAADEPVAAGAPTASAPAFSSSVGFTPVNDITRWTTTLDNTHGPFVEVGAKPWIFHDADDSKGLCVFACDGEQLDRGWDPVLELNIVSDQMATNIETFRTYYHDKIMRDAWPWSARKADTEQVDDFIKFIDDAKIDWDVRIHGVVHLLERSNIDKRKIQAGVLRLHDNLLALAQSCQDPIAVDVVAAYFGLAKHSSERIGQAMHIARHGFYAMYSRMMDAKIDFTHDLGLGVTPINALPPPVTDPKIVVTNSGDVQDALHKAKNNPLALVRDYAGGETPAWPNVFKWPLGWLGLKTNVVRRLLHLDQGTTHEMGLTMADLKKLAGSKTVATTARDQLAEVWKRSAGLSHLAEAFALLDAAAVVTRDVYHLDATHSSKMELILGKLDVAGRKLFKRLYDACSHYAYMVYHSKNLPAPFKVGVGIVNDLALYLAGFFSGQPSILGLIHAMQTAMLTDQTIFKSLNNCRWQMMCAVNGGIKDLALSALRKIERDTAREQNAAHVAAGVSSEFQTTAVAHGGFGASGEAGQHVDHLHATMKAQAIKGQGSFGYYLLTRLREKHQNKPSGMTISEWYANAQLDARMRADDLHGMPVDVNAFSMLMLLLRARDDGMANNVLKKLWPKFVERLPQKPTTTLDVVNNHEHETAVTRIVRTDFANVGISVPDTLVRTATKEFMAAINTTTTNVGDWSLSGIINQAFPSTTTATANFPDVLASPDIKARLLTYMVNDAVMHGHAFEYGTLQYHGDGWPAHGDSGELMGENSVKFLTTQSHRIYVQGGATALALKASELCYNETPMPINNEMGVIMACCHDFYDVIKDTQTLDPEALVQYAKQHKDKEQVIQGWAYIIYAYRNVFKPGPIGDLVNDAAQNSVMCAHKGKGPGNQAACTVETFLDTKKLEDEVDHEARKYSKFQHKWLHFLNEQKANINNVGFLSLAGLTYSSGLVTQAPHVYQFAKLLVRGDQILPLFFTLDSSQQPVENQWGIEYAVAQYAQWRKERTATSTIAELQAEINLVFFGMMGTLMMAKWFKFPSKLFNRLAHTSRSIGKTALFRHSVEVWSQFQSTRRATALRQTMRHFDDESERIASKTDAYAVGDVVDRFDDASNSTERGVVTKVFGLACDVVGLSGTDRVIKSHCFHTDLVYNHGDAAVYVDSLPLVGSLITCCNTMHIVVDMCTLGLLCVTLPTHGASKALFWVCDRSIPVVINDRHAVSCRLPPDKFVEAALECLVFSSL